MRKVAIIGAGISGLSAAHFLKDRYDVTVFEKESMPGGLIKCRRVNGNLFHTCGGHVFNSKRQDVLDWFWSIFGREEEFSKTDRNAVISLEDGTIVPYPIENYMYLFDSNTQKKIIKDFLLLAKQEDINPANFEDFLKNRFGDTLYNMYFQPYNEKVWHRNLKLVPISWLEGKLPTPTVDEIIYNNINHVKEKKFVHSTFWYEKNNGSQYIADKLAKEIDIHYGVDVDNIKSVDGKWVVSETKFDSVIFCGNIKDVVSIIEGVNISAFKNELDLLEYHGTTAVFCEIDDNPYSWIYQPSRKHESHRIICTGNFAKSNTTTTPLGRTTATIEFTDKIDKESIIKNLAKMPLNPKYIDHKYNKFTYPIQNSNTRCMIQNLKKELYPKGFYFTGRFADWEYYNMDVAIGSAMDLCNSL